MVKIFNGKEFALQKELEVKKEVVKLKKRGVTPKLVSIVVGDVGGSKFYQNLKKKAAERIGLELEIKRFSEGASVVELTKLIQKLNKDLSVHGLMIQLPVPDNLKVATNEIINAIDPKKDVDGLRQDSFFVPPVVRAILEALKKGREYLVGEPKIVVVGAKGFVGKKVVKAFKAMGYRVEGVDIQTKDLNLKTSHADLLVSTTGKPGLIKQSMIKTGSVVIDVGAPKGDLDPKAYEKSAFITPVPGGIGPVTIICLLENLTIAASGST